MKNISKIVALMSFVLTMLFVSCAIAQTGIDLFIMDFPHGERRIHIMRTGEAYLYYGAKPSAKIIAKNTFSAEDLFDIFTPYLHQTLPREKWPDPESQSGMVTVRYMNGEKQDFLIFDLHELTSEIFEKAEKNIAGEML